VKHLDRFKALSREKKLLFLFVVICFALPFIIVRYPTHYFPLFIYFQGEIGHWFASGKPFWQITLACYGVSSLELMGWYFGSFGIRILIEKAMNWLKPRLERGIKIPLRIRNQYLFLKLGKGYKKINSFLKKRRGNFAEWLNRQSIWIIFFFLLLPLPFTDIAAGVALGAKKIKYGHWYLVAVNLPHIILIVYLIYWGVDFFFF
jgi:hypothetical protein